MRRDINRIIEGRYRGRFALDGAGGGILETIRDTYAPLILLGFDETSGTTAVDSSGNGLDLTYQNSPTLGVAGVFSNDGTGFTTTSAGGEYASRADGITVSGGLTIIWAGRIDEIAGNDRLVDINTGASRAILYKFNQNLQYFGPNNFDSGRDIGAGTVAMWAARYNEADSSLSENGLRFCTDSLGLALSFSDAPIAVGASTPGTEPAGATHTFCMVTNEILTDDQIYDIAKLIGAAPSAGHYYKEVIEANGLDSFCVAHYPLWETAGAQAIDVSGNENHGTYVGGPALQQTANNAQAVYSVDLNGINQRIDTGVALDVNTDTFTASGWFNVDAASNRFGALMSNHVTGGRSEIRINATGNKLLHQVFDGTNQSTFVCSSGDDVLGAGWVHVAWVWDRANNQSRVYVNGTLAGEDTDTSDVGALTGEHTVFNFGRGYAGNMTGELELLSVFNAALSDAAVTVLNGGDFTPWYQTVLDTYSTGLVATYDFAEDPTGGTLTDRSSNGFDATWSGSPTQVTGSDQSITAVNLPNAADHAQTPSDVYGINLANDDFTWHARFRIPSGTGDHGIFAVHTSSTNYILLWVDGPDLDFQLSNVDIISAGVDVRDGDWHDVVVKRDTTEDAIRMWLDGVEVAEDTNLTASLPDAVATNEGEIGRVSLSGIADFIGEFDAFDVWNIALDDADCLAISQGAP